MKPSENWRSVFLLPQSTKKKKKNSKGNSSPSSPRLHFPELQWEPKTTTTTAAPTTAAERRHTMSGPTPRSMLNVQSPDSDVSPKTPIQPSDQTKTDYFSIESSSQAQSQKKDEETKANDAEPLSRATTLSSFASPSPLESATGSFSAESSRTESYGGRPRGSSIASLSFAPLRNPSLPQGNQKKTNKERIRASSPPPERPEASDQEFNTTATFSAAMPQFRKPPPGADSSVRIGMAGPDQSAIGGLVPVMAPHIFQHPLSISTLRSDELFKRLAATPANASVFYSESMSRCGPYLASLIGLQYAIRRITRHLIESDLAGSG
ncbi:hypothetical protein CTAM01_10677 [Colletotrichum tamarilloi]|uniref:Uncharacterized protein n=1 Tax=Colletotrichum tamarilloi TaxID=1209934 RepID=A0ABQ9QZM8_9PEZI|nr:uncharacterized protein CTAM01_10677 [Colletotrichum tamarilloi]KAK1490388.1 hypothetical protein CTAM01_10677 [Colletotrichum tamarilloi]